MRASDRCDAPWAVIITVGVAARAGSLADAMPLAQAGEHGIVVHEIAEHGQRDRIAAVQGQVDGVPNTETHAEVGGAKDLHGYTLHCKDRYSFAL